MGDPISEFRGEYHFLSSFYAVDIHVHNLTFKNIEAAFQASKSHDPRDHAAIAQLSNPVAAKRAGRKVQLRSDWESVKEDVMLDLLRQKFSNPDFRAKLLATGDRLLCEGNKWHDQYWGACLCPKHGGTGRNVLGQLLMRIRTEMQQEEPAAGTERAATNIAENQSAEQRTAEFDERWQQMLAAKMARQ